MGTHDYLAWDCGHSSCSTGEAAAVSGADAATPDVFLPLRTESVRVPAEVERGHLSFFSAAHAPPAGTPVVAVGLGVTLVIVAVVVVDR